MAEVGPELYLDVPRRLLPVRFYYADGFSRKAEFLLDTGGNLTVKHILEEFGVASAADRDVGVARSGGVGAGGPRIGRILLLKPPYPAARGGLSTNVADDAALAAWPPAGATPLAVDESTGCVPSSAIAAARDGEATAPPESAVLHVTAHVEDMVARGFGCNGCGAVGLRGRWWRCHSCRNFDLCSSCHSDPADDDLRKHNEDHASDFSAFVREPSAASEVVGSTVEETLFALWRNWASQLCVAERPRPHVGGPEGKLAAYKWYTYRDIYELTIDLSWGLRTHIRVETASGSTPPTMLGIFAANSVEWLVADFASTLLNLTCVPIGLHMADDEVTSVVGQTRPSIIVVDLPLLHRLLAVSVPGWNPLFVVIECSTEGILRLEVRRCVTWQTIVEDGRRQRIAAAESGADEWPLHKPDPDTVRTLVFTSGSTGSPKGAVLTERVLAARTAASGVPLRVTGTRSFEYAPFSHTTARYNTFNGFIRGQEVGLFNRPLTHLWQDLQAVKPTVLVCVPRIFEMMKDIARAEEEAAAARGETDVARSSAEAIRSLVGGRVRRVVTGGAATSADTMHFLTRVFGKGSVMEGYGATEVGTIAFDGRVPEGVEVRLSPVDGVAEAADPSVEIGEIEVRSDTIVPRYWGTEAHGDKFTDGGWYRTGDLGKRDHTGRVTVIERLNNVVKLPHGEFVCLERVEQLLSTGCRVVDMCFAYADAVNGFVVALIIPCAATLASLLRDRGCGLESEALMYLCDHPEAKAAVSEVVSEACVSVGLRPYETPRSIGLESTPFTVATGELTSTLKLARRTIVRKRAESLRTACDEAASIGDRGSVVSVLRRFGGIEQLAAAGADSLVSARLAAALRSAGISGAENVVRETLAGVSSVDDILTVLHGSSSGGRATVGGAGGAETGAKPLHVTASADDATAIHDATSMADLFDSDAFTIPRDLPGRLRPLRTLLLTGATGFVGGEILLHLLRNRTLRLVCLVRGNAELTAEERLDSLITSRCGEDEESLLQFTEARSEGRVEVLAGNLSKPRVGLTEDEFPLLARRVDAIVHCGAEMNWGSSYAALRAANVLGTHTMLQLAAAATRHAGMLCAVHFVSTLSVVSEAKEGSPPDVSLLGDQSQLNGYAQSKIVAELSVVEARRRGYAVSVYRLGMITWHSKSGWCNVDDFATRCMRAMIGFRACPDAATAFDVLPVDCCADAIASLVFAIHDEEATLTSGSTYHIANERPPSWTDLCRLLVGTGLRVVEIPYRAFRERIVEEALSTAHHPDDSAEVILQACRAQAIPLLPFLPATTRAPGSSPRHIDLTIRAVSLAKGPGEFDPRSEWAVTSAEVGAWVRGMRLRGLIPA